MSETVKVTIDDREIEVEKGTGLVETAAAAGIEIPVREVLFRMECNGVLIDSNLLGVQSHELGQKMPRCLRIE